MLLSANLKGRAVAFVQIFMLTLTCLGLSACKREAAALKPPVVLAAASLQPAMEAVARDWVKLGHARPVFSFAASSALARQIDAGAPADLFVSADDEWMNYLEKKGRIDRGTRHLLLGNRLVLVGAPNGQSPVELSSSTPLLDMLGASRLAIADPDAVPAGRYAKAALRSLGLWNEVKDRLAPAQNVRAALAMVERGQTPYGIVYATDAKSSREVQIVGLFPTASHPPIHYPMAQLASSRSGEAEPFRHFLTSATAKAIFARYGFDTE